jgi:hypothetical protein
VSTGVDDLMYYLIKILFLVKTMKTESIDLKNNLTQSTLKQWGIERHDSIATNIEADQSETSSSFEFCIPFYTCPTNLNRTILTILVPIFLLICCFYYHCYEYCKVKRDLDQERFENFPQYYYIDVSVHKKTFVI